MKLRTIASLLALLLAATVAVAQAVPEIKYTEYRLSNGLRVILHEDHSTPIVGVNIWYHVGSKNEVPGKTGFAHLFEHMMFQGSKNWNDDFFIPLQEAGGTLNGSTNVDRTNYWEVVPSNFLELALFLEADRMAHLLDAMTEEKLANQRDVVKNEKRQGLDNVPYGRARERIPAAMYPPDHPYHWLTIGSLDDLTAASMEDVKDFFRRFYTPNNASLAIAGDFDPAAARRLVEKYFGAIPRGPAKKTITAAQPKLEKEVRQEMDDRVSLPRIYINWHTIPRFTKDEPALDVLQLILGGGKSSRLYRSLVYEKQIAQDVNVSHPAREIAGTFQIIATAKPDVTLQKIEQSIDEELAKIRENPPTAEEVSRAYNNIESASVFALSTVGGFGGKNDQLNEYAIFRNDPGWLDEDLARFRAVTPAEVQRVARQYLTPNRLVFSVLPRAATPPKAAAPAAESASEVKPTGDKPTGVPAQTQAEKAATPAGGSAPPAAAAPAAPKEKEAKPSKDKLPKPGADPKLTLPAVQRQRLSNGLAVLVVEHHELPVIGMGLMIKNGAAAEGKLAGLATLTADLLDEGTAKRNALQISDELANIGARLQTSANWDSSNVVLVTLTRHLDKALDLFSDIATNANFPEKEVSRLKAQRLTALKQRRDSATDLAADVYPRLLYGGSHPYGHALLGDESAVGAITAADIRKFYETYYRPGGATLIVVGDVTPSKIVPKLEKAFASWKGMQVPGLQIATPSPRERTTIYVVDKPGAAQSVISVGHVGVPRSTSDYFPLLVMNTMLGGQFTSRLNMNLRESKGYTYGARSAFDYRRGAGPFSAGAGVQTAVTKESVIEFMKELRGIRGEIPITDEELAFAKQSIIRGFPRGFETPEQIATRLFDVVLYDLPDNYFNTYIQRVAAVTKEDVVRVAQKYLDPSRSAVLVVGDEKVIGPGLRSLEDVGTVTVLDSEGRPVTLAQSNE